MVFAHDVISEVLTMASCVVADGIIAKVLIMTSCLKYPTLFLPGFQRFCNEISAKLKQQPSKDKNIIIRAGENLFKNRN